MDPLEKYYFQNISSRSLQQGDNDETNDNSNCSTNDINNKIAPITENYVENYPSIIDRFFTRYYSINKRNPKEKYSILFHSNRVCLLCLAPNHEVFDEGVKAITFDVGSTNRSLNQVKGKGKKGGMALQEDSILAIVTGKNEKTYKVPSCIRGKLIEVNERLIINPELMKKEGDGYIALILPKPENCDEIKANLLTLEDYENSRNEENVR